jgi:hypothetical protein
MDLERALTGVDATYRALALPTDDRVQA